MFSCESVDEPTTLFWRWPIYLGQIYGKHQFVEIALFMQSLIQLCPHLLLPHITKPTSSSKIHLLKIYTDTLNFLLLTCYHFFFFFRKAYMLLYSYYWRGMCDLWTSLDVNAKTKTIGIQTLYQQFQSLPNPYRLKSTSCSIFFITSINQINVHEKQKHKKQQNKLPFRLVDSLKFHTYHLSKLIGVTLYK